MAIAQFIPNIPLSNADFWEFEGDLSYQVNEAVQWRTFNREFGAAGVSDGATRTPSSVSISGVLTATPTRFSARNPGGPFVGPTYLQDSWQELVALQQRLVLGTLLLPDFGLYTSMAIGTVSGNKSDARRRIAVTIQFQKINVVSLVTVPAVLDADAQALRS